MGVVLKREERSGKAGHDASISVLLALPAFAHGFEVYAASCPCSVSLALACLAVKDSGWYP